ncbi:hypothetical protein C8A00DRAFT_35991, partial [Chaetomidium leptoderma]
MASKITSTTGRIVDQTDRIANKARNSRDSHTITKANKGVHRIARSTIKGQKASIEASGQTSKTSPNKGALVEIGKVSSSKPNALLANSKSRSHIAANDTRRDKMWQHQAGDELDINLDEVPVYGVAVYDVRDSSVDDEILEDAPEEQPAQERSLAGANLQTLQAFVGELLDQNPRGPAPGDRTVQAWQQQQQQTGGFGQLAQRDQTLQQRHEHSREYDQWTQGHHEIRTKTAIGWGQSQQRLLEEQKGALYNLYCEIEKVKTMLREAYEERQAQEQQAQQQTQTTTPLTLTHPQKLAALLDKTTTLTKNLTTTQHRLTAHETALAHSENRPPRTSEILVFFDAQRLTTRRAASHLQRLWRAAHKAEDIGGPFRVVDRAETRFCAAWEGVVVWGGYYGE